MVVPKVNTIAIAPIAATSQLRRLSGRSDESAFTTCYSNLRLKPLSFTEPPRLIDLHRNYRFRECLRGALEPHQPLQEISASVGIHEAEGFRGPTDAGEHPGQKGLEESTTRIVPYILPKRNIDEMMGAVTGSSRPQYPEADDCRTITCALRYDLKPVTGRPCHDR